MIPDWPESLKRTLGTVLRASYCNYSRTRGLNILLNLNSEDKLYMDYELPLTFQRDPEMHILLNELGKYEVK